MDKQKMTLFAGMIAMIIVFAIFSSFWGVIFSTGGSIPVLWPSPTVETSPNGGNASNVRLVDGYQRIQITPKSVQPVIKTLARPQQYSQTIQLTLFWGESKQSVISIVCSKAGEYSAAKAVQSGQVQYSIWGNGTLYRWYQGEQNWYQGRVSFMTGDLLQRIPTYETILSLKQDQILSAEYVALNQRTCIYVESAESSINTRIHYWIDAEQGVLLRAEAHRDDRMIWCIEVSEFSTTTIDESLFCLPNGVDVRTLASQSH